MILSGERDACVDFIEGVEMLTSMRLCANVLAQLTVEAALSGHQSIRDLVAPTGRLCMQRDFLWQRLTQIPGVSCMKPKGALYLFPRLDTELYPIEDDEEFALGLLRTERVLIVQGTSFHLSTPDHFRLTILPDEEMMLEAITRIERYLSRIRIR